MSQLPPVVSVIMPCYNQGEFLDEAVDSVLAQTYQRFEIVVINDGSTDPNTIHRLQNYDKPQVRVLHTANHGPASARNTGIEQSSGQYILPLDADDRVAPTYLEQAVQILEQNSAVGIVYSQAEFFGTKTGPCHLPTYQFPEILLGNMIFNSSFFRKTDWEKVGGYNPNMVDGWEDYDFWLSLIDLGREVVQIPERLYFYRQVPDSRSDRLTRERQITSYTQLFHNHRQLYTDNISVLFQHIMGMREDLHLTHSRLEKVQIELDHWRNDALQAQREMEHWRKLTAAMQSSKFWQLRQRWIHLKQRLGLKVNDAIDDYLPKNP